MGESNPEKWLHFYRPHFGSEKAARAFVVPIEDLRRGDPGHSAKLIMHQAQRLISLSDDLPGIRKGNESLRLLFMIICAEHVAKLADGFTGEGSSRRYVREFFEKYLAEDQQRAITSGLTNHRMEPLTLRKAVDALYQVRCDVVHEGKYWGFHFNSGDVAILNSEPDIIAHITLEEFRRHVVRGAITAAKTVAGQL